MTAILSRGRWVNIVWNMYESGDAFYYITTWTSSSCPIVQNVVNQLRMSEYVITTTTTENIWVANLLIFKGQQQNLYNEHDFDL